MLTPFFLKSYTTQSDAMQRDLEFYQLCFERFEFLTSDYGFEARCDGHSGPDSFVDVRFTRNPLTIHIQKDAWCLPELRIGPSCPAGLLADIKARGWQSHHDFEEEYKRVHPLDRIGQREVAQRHFDAERERISQFADFLR